MNIAKTLGQLMISRDVAEEMAKPIRKLRLDVEGRIDGGLRITSPDEPGLILSSVNPEKVLAQVWPALTALDRARVK